MSGDLGIPPGDPGSGRARYGRAMALHAAGRITPSQLEAYRVAAADDHSPPDAVFADRGLPLPADAAPDPAALISALVDEADDYLRTLRGPDAAKGVAEVRALLSRWRGGAVNLTKPTSDPVVAAHLPAALDALAGDRPGLAATIAAAAPLLSWAPYDSYPRDQIGEAFATGHAFASIIGDGAPIPATDFDFGLFLIAPHILYRDHAHPAPELYAPLTGPHGWRFGRGRALHVKAAHRPVWNPPLRPHLTKVGPVPFLCLFAWTRDTALAAHVIPRSDWPLLEALTLG